MRLRYYATLLTGAFAEIVSANLLWLLTDIPLYGVAFWSVLAYFNGIAIVWNLTEPKKRKKKKIDGPTIYTLTEHGWERAA